MISYNPENVFAKILEGEIPTNKVYESDYILAFRDISPIAKEHILVIPKSNYVNFDEFITKAPNEEIIEYFRTIGNITRELDLDKTGYRIISNIGQDGNQTVMHFHVHIIGGEFLGNLDFSK